MAKVNFKGSLSLVTGASSGIGLEFARQIAARGGDVVLVARRQALLEQLAQEVAEQHGVKAYVYCADLSVPGASRELFAQLKRDGLGVDHLVNNAGFGDASEITPESAEKFVRMVQVNCTAVTELSALMLPRMKEKNQGGVLTVASLVGFMPMPYMTVYAASKAYARSFMMGLAVELKDTNIRSLALCPGRVPTEFEKSAGFDAGRGWVPGQLTAAQTVSCALRAYDRRKAVYISGFANRLLAFALRLLPGMLMARINGSVVKKGMELGR